jgi:hypothetical protein
VRGALRGAVGRAVGRQWAAKFVLAAAVALLPMLPWSAHAQATAPAQPTNPGALPSRQANYAWDGDLLRASYSYKDVLTLDPALLKKLSSGLPMVIAMRAYVYREGELTPVALAVRVCRVVYDLWDEVYRIHLSEPERDRNQAVIVIDGVFRVCTDARDFPVVRRGLLEAGVPYFLGVVVDINPVSQDMLEQIRRWMSRPTGSTGLLPTDALFGGFVQLFAPQIAVSDATLRFRTPDVKP